MKATILSHHLVPDGAEAEIHRFMFCLEDGTTAPRVERISLRTARVLAATPGDGHAFMLMLREIVRTDPADYDSLIGRSFTDSFEYRAVEASAVRKGSP